MLLLESVIDSFDFFPFSQKLKVPIIFIIILSLNIGY